MSLIMIVLIAVSLSMDAFAVSVSNGIALRTISTKDSMWTGIFFGVFQFLMPVIGWILGTSVKSYIEAIDHWVAFGLLLIIGGGMIKEALFCDEEDDCSCEVSLSSKKLALQAVATSIDALAVGISFAVLDVNVLFASAVIGVICFVISFTGCKVGKTIGHIVQEKAEIAGGIVLILIGFKILVEHLFM